MDSIAIKTKICILATVVASLVLLVIFRPWAPSAPVPVDRNTSTPAPAMTPVAATPFASVTVLPPTAKAIQSHVIDGIVVSDNKAPPYPKDKRGQAEWAVQVTYAEILEQFNLRPEILAKIKDILAERFLTGIDARMEAGVQHLGIAEANQLVAQLNAESDGEIKALVDPTTYGKIAEMIANTPALGFARAIVTGSLQNPIRNVDQVLALSNIRMRNYYNNPNIQSDEISGIDPVTGLSAIDRTVIAQASQILNGAQLALLTHDLALQTHTYLITAQAEAEEYKIINKP
jgi:hypothetical protein